jgi:hypothetical protein
MAGYHSGTKTAHRQGWCTLAGSHERQLSIGSMIYLMAGAAMSVPDNVENHVAESDLMEAMRRAFQMVCDALGLHSSADARTGIVSSKIVEFVKAGEVDPERLCYKVLRALNARKNGK